MKKLLTIGLLLMSSFGSFAQDTTWTAKLVIKQGSYTDTAYFGISSNATAEYDSGVDVIDTAIHNLPVAIRSGVKALQQTYGCASLKTNYFSPEELKDEIVDFAFYIKANFDDPIFNPVYIWYDSVDYVVTNPFDTIAGTIYKTFSGGYVYAVDNYEYIPVFYRWDQKKYSYRFPDIQLWYEGATNECSPLFSLAYSIYFGNSNVSINEPKFFKTGVYPNPTNGISTIKFSVPATGKLLLFNAQGEVVKQSILKAAEDIQLNCSDLPKGVYFISISDLNTSQKYFEKLMIY